MTTTMTSTLTVLVEFGSILLPWQQLYHYADDVIVFCVNQNKIQSTFSMSTSPMKYLWFDEVLWVRTADIPSSNLSTLHVKPETGLWSRTLAGTCGTFEVFPYEIHNNPSLTLTGVVAPFNPPAVPTWTLAKNDEGAAEEARSHWRSSSSKTKQTFKY